MEGVPRMPMLSVELKFSPVSADFSPKILQYIAKAYQEEPTSYRKEIDELNDLRQNAVNAATDVSGCGILKKYFAQLNLLKSRFPMETNDECSVAFTWYEKYADMPNPVTYEDIRYEMACVMHNIGAMHSFLGSLDNRLSSEGMKIACTHFQCAAWAFQTLRSGSFNAATFCSDFDSNILNWHSNLMLAQAQECILEKSLVDNRKFNIIAKIAVQTAEFYKDCIKCLEQQSVSDVVSGSRCRSWKKFVEMKYHYYAAIGFLYLGNQSEEIQKTAKEQKMGERVAYFQAAADRLVDSLKLAQKESEIVKEALKFTNDVIVGKLTNAKKENDFIYHDKIPSLDSLPEVKGAVLVKGIAFDPLDVDVSGADIFQRLIPLGVHQASSLYSEEKAKLLRGVVAKIETKNENLKRNLDALHFDELHLDEDFSKLPLPESLLERCAAFNAKPDAVPDLVAAMQKLSTLYSEVDAAMTELDNQLKDAEKDFKSDEEKYGKNPEFGTLGGKLKDLREEFAQYVEANLRATRSNKELHKAMAAHTENLKLLTLPLSELKKQLPAPSCSAGDTMEGGELKRIRAKVDEMSQQREMLLEQLRAQVLQDDLTKVLLANREKDPSEIFDKELRKFDKQIGVIDQNLSAQENILKALTESNAKFAKIRQQTSEIVKQRDAKLLSLVAAFDVYVDLIDKSKQGTEFYRKLQKNLSDFNEKMAKFGEELNDVEFKFKAQADKASAAQMAKANVEADGPKLKDYLAYYKAKKTGVVPPTNVPQGQFDYSTQSQQFAAQSNQQQFAQTGQQQFPTSQALTYLPPQQQNIIYQQPAHQQLPQQPLHQIPQQPANQMPQQPIGGHQQIPQQIPAHQQVPQQPAHPQQIPQQLAHQQQQLPAHQQQQLPSAHQQQQLPAHQQQQLPAHQQQQLPAHQQQQLPAHQQQMPQYQNVQPSYSVAPQTSVAYSLRQQPYPNPNVTQYPSPSTTGTYQNQMVASNINNSGQNQQQFMNPASTTSGYVGSQQPAHQTFPVVSQQQQFQNQVGYPGHQQFVAPSGQQQFQPSTGQQQQYSPASGQQQFPSTTGQQQQYQPTSGLQQAIPVVTGHQQIGQFGQQSQQFVAPSQQQASTTNQPFPATSAQQQQQRFSTPPANVYYQQQPQNVYQQNQQQATYNALGGGGYFPQQTMSFTQQQLMDAPVVDNNPLPMPLQPTLIPTPIESTSNASKSLI